MSQGGHRAPHRPRTLFGAILLASSYLASSALSSPAAAEEKDIETLADRLVGLRAEVESIHDDIQSLQRKHENTTQSLVQRRADLDTRIQREELELRKLQRKLAKLRGEANAASEEAEALRPMLKELLSRVETHLGEALPFKREERRGEIETLRTRIEADEVSVSRAIQQLWSFLEDELRLVEENGLFRQTIALAGEEELVDVLRLGMTMLFFETADDRRGFAVRRGDEWAWRVVEGDRADQVASLFDSFESQNRTGYFQVPNGLPGVER